jgi:hypothetical protein
MHNQHAGLSQALAEQHMTDRRERASHALGRGIGPPIRRRPSRAPRWDLQPGGCWQPIRWPAVTAEPPSRRPHCVS